MLESTTRYEPLGSLLSEIESGRLALPAFQRDFDWGPADVRALLATLLKGWPAGSILLLEGDARFLEMRGFEGGPEPTNPDALVLDGQQRLTALYQALTGTGPYVYGVLASALGETEVDELERGILSAPKRSWSRLVARYASDVVIPFTALSSDPAFYSWRDSVGVQASLLEAQPQALRLLDESSRQLRLHDYRFPVTAIQSPTPIEDVARIFERVNRTGLQLGAFDLAVARVYEKTWDLREQWEEAALEFPALDEFLKDDGLPVLQVISLRESADIRRAAVLSLDRSVIHREWDRAVVAMNEAISFLRENCGVALGEWIPYQGMVVPLAALSLELEIPLASETPLLKQWFFSRAFSLRFDAAVNTRLVEDYGELVRAVRAGELGVPPANGDLILTATRRRQGALWRAFMCALVDHGAQDLVSHEPLVTEVGREGDGRDIVAAPFFAMRNEEAADLRGRILNFVVASRTTARHLRKEGAEWLPMARLTNGFSAALSSQFFNADALSMDVPGVFRQRVDNLSGYLLRVAQQRVEWERPPDEDLDLVPVPAETRMELREIWLNRLRNEFVVAHPDEAEGILEGTRELPVNWLQERLTQLGLLELFST